MEVVIFVKKRPGMHFEAAVKLGKKFLAKLSVVVICH